MAALLWNPSTFFVTHNVWNFTVKLLKQTHDPSQCNYKFLLFFLAANEVDVDRLDYRLYKGVYNMVCLMFNVNNTTQRNNNKKIIKVFYKQKLNLHIDVYVNTYSMHLYM